MKTSVKFLCALLTALLLFACTSCRKSAETTEPLTPEQQTPSPSVDGPLYEGTDLAGSPFVGTFASSYSALFASDADDVYVTITEAADGTLNKTPTDKPTLVCKSDGTFTLTVCDSIGGSWHTLNGTFTVSGETAEFTVAQGEYGDFIGADTQKFALKLTSKDDLRYWGDQIGTVYGGDVFTRAAA